MRFCKLNKNNWYSEVFAFITIFVVIFAVVLLFFGLAQADIITDSESIPVNNEVINQQEDIAIVEDENSNNQNVLEESELLPANPGPVANEENPVANYLTFTMLKDSKIALKNNGTINSKSLDYKLGDGDWQTYNLDSEITVSNGVSIKFRGNNPTGLSESSEKYLYFAIDGSANANGSVMSLIDNIGTSTSIPCDYCFCRLFNECAGLKQPPQLPATTLKMGCYYYMFNKSGITTIPELPAKTVPTFAYYWMFGNCEGLNNSDNSMSNNIMVEEPTGGANMSYIFYNCKNLINAPNFKNLKCLTPSIFECAFYGCSNLITVPDLNFMELKVGCYKQMFANCSSLTNAPSLPATVLQDSCYYSMFVNTGINSIDLPAEHLAKNCYTQMFKFCTNLSDIKISFHNWDDASNSTEDWVSSLGQQEDGKFICPGDLEIKHGVSYIPEGFNVKKNCSSQELNNLIRIESQAVVFDGSQKTLNLRVMDVINGELTDVTDCFNVSGTTGTELGTYTWSVTGKGPVNDINVEGISYSGSTTGTWQIVLPQEPEYVNAWGNAATGDNLSKNAICILSIICLVVVLGIYLRKEKISIR